MTSSIEPASGAYLRNLITVYSKWESDQHLIAECLYSDVTEARNELNDLKKREIEVLKKGSHNPWTPWVYVAATAASVVAFCFLANPITIGAVVSAIALAGSFYQIAYTANNLITEQRKLTAQAEQKLLKTDYFLIQNATEKTASFASDLVQSMRNITEMLRHAITSQT